MLGKHVRWLTTTTRYRFLSLPFPPTSVSASDVLTGDDTREIRHEPVGDKLSRGLRFQRRESRSCLEIETLRLWLYPTWCLNYATAWDNGFRWCSFGGSIANVNARNLLAMLRGLLSLAAFPLRSGPNFSSFLSFLSPFFFFLFFLSRSTLITAVENVSSTRGWLRSSLPRLIAGENREQRNFYFVCRALIRKRGGRPPFYENSAHRGILDIFPTRKLTK